MRVAIYGRVSTTDQSCEMQLSELRQYAKSRSWRITAEYIDRGWSGAKANRPQLDRLMRDSRRRAFDVVIVYKLDRWGRSLPHCIDSLQELRSVGVRWIAITQNIDTDESNPMARLLLHLLAAFAEFERELIRERVSSGLKSAKEHGTRSGRSIGRPRVVFHRDDVVPLRNAGLSWSKIARKLGAGVTTVRRAYQHLSTKGGRPTPCQNPSAEAL